MDKNKGEGMKLYAVVIGKKDVDDRYVNYHPDYLSDDILAVSDDYIVAHSLKQKTMTKCQHNSVYVIKFEEINNKGKK